MGGQRHWHLPGWTSESVQVRNRLFSPWTFSFCASSPRPASPRSQLEKEKTSMENFHGRVTGFSPGKEKKLRQETGGFHPPRRHQTFSSLALTSLLNEFPAPSGRIRQPRSFDALCSLKSNFPLFFTRKQSKCWIHQMREIKNYFGILPGNSHGYFFYWRVINQKLVIAILGLSYFNSILISPKIVEIIIDNLLKTSRYSR